MEVCKKVSFCNEQYAMEYIIKLSKTSIREVKPIRAYLCEKCLNWHLTSHHSNNESIAIENDILKNKILELEDENKELKIENKNIKKENESLKNKNNKLKVSYNDLLHKNNKLVCKNLYYEYNQ